MIANSKPAELRSRDTDCNRDTPYGGTPMEALLSLRNETERRTLFFKKGLLWRNHENYDHGNIEES